MKHNVLATIRRVLRPLVQIAIKNDVMHGDFANELRSLYLEVAREMARTHGREVSETRIRLLTGLPTAELRGLRSSKEAEGPTVPATQVDSHTMAATVLSAWHTFEKYAGYFGVTVELPFDAPAGMVSFVDLVKSVDPGWDPELILERLIDADSVFAVPASEWDSDVAMTIAKDRGATRRVTERYQVKSRLYMAKGMNEEGVQYFGDMAERFLTTLSHNLSGIEEYEKRMERSVFADRGIPLDKLEEFQAMVKAGWNRFSTPLDTWLNAPGEHDTSDGKRVVQTGVGIYHYVYSETPDAGSEQDSGHRREGD